MNEYLKKFVLSNYTIPGLALDLGCGNGKDVEGLSAIEWDATGIDRKEANLEKPYQGRKQYDLVYSNYVLMFINNKEIFINTIYNNLKSNGNVFLHVLSDQDSTLKNGLSEKKLINLFSKKFINIKIIKRKIWDDEPGHNHWHHVLELTAQKEV